MTALYPYSSTHRIEVLGEGLRKDCSPSGRLAEVSARPAYLENPEREPAAYRDLLGPVGIGPRLLASGSDWVLLEHVRAPELWQVGELPSWVGVAGWTATMHATLQEAAGRGHSVPLLHLDETFFATSRGAAARNGAAAAILAAHQRATERLLAAPRTLIHGDFYPSNLLVKVVRGIEVWPVDWELIGVGPAVIDLAALSSGAWSETARQMMAEAYFVAAGYPTTKRVADLLAARLHLCVQWIGSGSGWVAPAPHRHDWHAEALELSERL